MEQGVQEALETIGKINNGILWWQAGIFRSGNLIYYDYSKSGFGFIA